MIYRIITCIGLYLLVCSVYGQNSNISGHLVDSENGPITFANVILFEADADKIKKVEISDDEGYFHFEEMPHHSYKLVVKFLGFEDVSKDINLTEDIDLGQIVMQSSSIQLEEAEITAQRAMVEVKADRTVFNVQGTINSAGDNGLELLRKAPGVALDNNNGISVLNRSGVLVYVNGKRLPMEGTDLSNYLQNLTSDQIDRIDIITSPGAKYEAEGNAGIIDIILKKDETIGTNGSLNFNASSGIASRANLSGSANYRNKKMNVFGSAGHSFGDSYLRMDFYNLQNNIKINEIDIINTRINNTNVRFGTDFFVHPNHTIGFLVDGNLGPTNIASSSDMEIFGSPNLAKPDSVLDADNTETGKSQQFAYNVNYQYRKAKTSVNFDIDYGQFGAARYHYQPNEYYAADLTTLLSKAYTEYYTPSNINIFSSKLDYEVPLGKGSFGTGAKFSNVKSDNLYDFYNIINDQSIQDVTRSNKFLYDENIYAGYATYGTQLSPKVGISAGVRAEYTDVKGELKAFVDSLQEAPVKLEYLKWFPNAGISYQIHPKHSLSLNYSKRINRPNYQVLNPFNIQLSELSYQKGNAKLQPEIVHNIELGYTAFYRYTFKLSYSKTYDQITRLIGPDEDDSRASFITWANLSEQEIYSANLSLPFQFSKKWTAFFNLNGGFQHNFADYGENGYVDVSTFMYTLYTQHAYDIYKGLKLEASGWFNGPGVWGGVFRFEPSWALSIGAQKRFFNNRFLVKFSVQDVFKEGGWSGKSEFNGLVSEGAGDWDSRRAKLALNYNFGSSKIKGARKRHTGIEKEQERLKQE